MVGTVSSGHGNFDIPPVVYRGPYEYSSPAQPEGQDYWPQWEPTKRGAVAASAPAEAH
ncbi:MAG: hypothetical protein R3B90_10440 [Planctomycetaceae bacterium]